MSDQAGRSFDRVLVANRGEVACRAIRACRAMGLSTVAVYSDADRGALHTRLADHAVHIGGAAPAASYLNGEQALAAARDSGAQAIHPGYGFLSENAAFAARCADEGLVFIGPPPAVIAAMGNKLTARRTMRAAGVPVIPGSEGALGGDAVAQAAEIGYPLMVKASGGGGGIGISRVDRPEALAAAVKAAAGRAERAFGDGTLYLERLLERPRHVEVQIVADETGAVLHAFERECSAQRRHQKVVEEAPSPALTAATRPSVLATGVAAGVAAGYTNIGTVEGLLDADGNYYFLEMNTRLQVEHAVTEAITGLDLVGLQLRLAIGEPLPGPQEAITMRGHAVECRVYAEDPRTMLPSPGRLTALRLPEGAHVRVETGVEEGDEITVYYDPLIAKIIGWGATRDEAIATTRAALDACTVQGVKTNLPLLCRILDDEHFRAGAYATDLIERLQRETQKDAS